MTHYTIDQSTDQSDRIFVEVDHRFSVVIARVESGIDLLVYPRTEGELWDYPFTTFAVDEAEVTKLEAQLFDSPEKGGGR